MNHAREQIVRAAAGLLLAFQVVQAQSGEFVPADRLEFYVPLDDFRDGITPDVSGHGRDGRVSGVEPETNGLFNGAVSFNGTNAWVDAGAWDVVGDQITISAWIQPRAGYQQVIIGRSIAPAHEAPFFRWLLFKGHHNRLHFRIGDAALDSSQGRIVDGEWQHVAAVYDGSHMRLYHDGRPVADAGRSARLEAGGQHVQIGGRDTPASGRAEFFDGSVDDVAVWSRALSGEEIAALYERGVRGIALSQSDDSAHAIEAGRSQAPAIQLLDTNAVPTIAVVPTGTDDVTRAAADLLQQKLAGDGAVKMVERADIEKVLKEQSLKAAFGAGNMDERVKLGGLLRADVLVFVDRRRSDDGKHELMEVTAAETRMGLRVVREIVPWTRDAPDQEVRRLADRVEKVLGRLRRGFNVIVAVPPFECRDISVDYLDLRKAYSHLAERILLSCPGVLVVDIEDADALARESFLSNVPAQIERPRPYYLRGNYRNDGLGPDRKISVELVLEQGWSSVGTNRMDGLREKDLAGAFEGALSELMGRLVTMPIRTRIASQQEARLLTEQGEAIMNTGSVLEAIPFLETAALLDPQFAEPRVLLFTAYSELDIAAYRRKASPDEHVDLMQKAYDYLESALPNWQGEHGDAVARSFCCSRFFPAFIQTMNWQACDPELESQHRTIVRRMAELSVRMLESPAFMNPAEYVNLEGTLDHACGWLGEFDADAGTAMRKRVIRAYARRPQSFYNVYRLIRKWLDQDVGGVFRKHLETCEDSGTRMALRVYDLAKVTRDLEQLNKAWPDIVQAAGDNGDLKYGLALVRERELEPGLQQAEPKPVELYVDQTLPPIRLERLDLEGVGRVNDWMSGGEYGETFAAEQGVFRLTAGGQARKMADGDTGRLVWDGLYLWAVQEGHITVLDRGGLKVADIKPEALNYGIHPVELNPVPLEPGWMCIIGNAEQDGTLRRWVTTVDIRGTNAGRPFVDTFFQTSADRREYLQNDWALKWKEGPPYIVLARGAQINVSDRTVSDYRGTLNDSRTFEKGRFVPYETAMKWQDSILLVTSSRDGSPWPRDQVVSAILELSAVDRAPGIWLMHPPGLNLMSGGSAPWAHRAVFIADGWMHFIFEPDVRPAWIATDLKTKKTRVVSYDLPREINSYKTSFRVFPSETFGVVMTVEGVPYKVKLPPRTRWPFFGSPKECHDLLVADPSTTAHRLSCMTLSNVQDLVARHGNLDEQDEMGWSLLFHALARDDAELVRVLMKGGADTKRILENGVAAVQFASENGYCEGLRALLEQGIAPDLRGSDNQFSALFLAVRSRHPDCARVLLEHGADPNLQNTEERLVALHVAGWRGLFESAELLLEAGANPNAQNDRGHTPLHFAAARGYPEIVRMLLVHGADPSIKAPSFGDIDEMLTARDFAFYAKHAEVIRVFEEYAGRPDDR